MGRAGPGGSPWWHGDDRPPGRGGRPGLRDRRLGQTAQGPPPLPRVRPRVEHRLQRAVRRHALGGHRDSPNRRGVLGRPGDAVAARPHHRGRLLPPLRRGLDHGPPGGDQPGSAEGVVPAAGLILLPDRPDRRGRLDRGHRRAVQAGHGHLLQRHLGLLGVAGLARQHRRAAVSGPARRQPSLP